MVNGIIGGILGATIAFVLDLIGVDTYVLDFLQPYLNFKMLCWRYCLVYLL